MELPKTDLNETEIHLENHIHVLFGHPWQIFLSFSNVTCPKSVEIKV